MRIIYRESAFLEGVGLQTCVVIIAVEVASRSKRESQAAWCAPRYATHHKHPKNQNASGWV